MPNPDISLYLESSLFTDHKNHVFSSTSVSDTDPGMISFTENVWLVDTGVSSHISRPLNGLKNVKTKKNWNVLLPNNMKLASTHIGDLHISDTLILYDVLFVLSF